ncbi:MAG: hypothetical protein EYC68_06080 [Chloroflexota bacterium]|nr:MAG: hypothetical protein EYC68_06080 [Chloroflexota bacterium]
MKQPTFLKKKRPFGVYIIIVVLVVLAANYGADLVRIARGIPPQTLPELPGDADWVLFIATIAFFVILSVGLWRLHTWAWFAAMIAGGLTLFYCIWHVLNGGTPFVTMALLIVMVFYLNLIEVKAAFHAKPSEERF